MITINIHINGPVTINHLAESGDPAEGSPSNEPVAEPAHNLDIELRDGSGHLSCKTSLWLAEAATNLLAKDLYKLSQDGLIGGQNAVERIVLNHKHGLRALRASTVTIHEHGFETVHLDLSK